jgi:hypothetical protein
MIEKQLWYTGTRPLVPMRDIRYPPISFRNVSPWHATVDHSMLCAPKGNEDSDPNMPDAQIVKKEIKI